MKHIILAIAVVGASATMSFAQHWVKPTPAEITEQRHSLSAKTTELQNLLAKHQTSKAEEAADNLLTTMKRTVGQTRRVAETSGDQKPVIMKRMLEMEQMVSDFRTLASNVDKNGNKLIETAKAFQSKIPE